MCWNGDLDAGLVEASLDDRVVGAAGRPLLAGQGLDATAQHDRRVAEGGEAVPVERRKDRGPDLRVLAQLVEGGVHHRLGLVDVLAIGDADLGDVIGEAAHEVGDRIDRGERHDVVDALEIAQAERADRQPLDHARDAARGHHLALVDRVLELDEDPGDDVLHELLRPKPTARPSTPAPASRGAMLTPSSARRSISATRRQHRGRRRCGTAPAACARAGPAACRSWG